MNPVSGIWLVIAYVCFELIAGRLKLDTWL
jgi:hypothetical protein